MCADNFFTNILLVKYLYEKNLGYIGTLRQNKREIPLEFLPCKKRPVGDCLFGFDGPLTMVSHVAKPRKAVVLVSSVHHSSEIDLDTTKPQIILDYNKKKCGVDVLDQLIEASTCRRKTLRWTMNVLFFMLDVAAYNAYALYSLKHNLPLFANFERERFVSFLVFHVLELQCDHFV